MTLLGVGVALLGPFGLALVDARRGGRPRLGESLAGLAAYVGIVAFVLWIAFAWAGLSPESMGFRAPRWQSFVWGAVLALFFTRIYGPLLYRVIRVLRVRGFEGGLAKLHGLPFWYLALAVAIGGAAEEVLYRGYAIAQLEQLTGSVWLAAAIPLLVFTLAHWPLWGPAPALSTFFAGAIATAFFLWQRDLTPLVISHVATDFVGIVLSRRTAPRSF